VPVEQQRASAGASIEDVQALLATTADVDDLGQPVAQPEAYDLRRRSRQPPPYERFPLAQDVVEEGLVA
jgi:hypothetical protein